MKYSIKNPFPLAGKTASAVRNRKNLINWFTPNFKNCVHQQKKNPNKSTKFVIDQNPFPLARMKDSLKKAISLDRKATSMRISI